MAQQKDDWFDQFEDIPDEDFFNQFEDEEPTEPVPVTGPLRELAPPESVPDTPSVMEPSWWEIANTPLTNLPSRAVREIGTRQVFEPMREKTDNPLLASVIGFFEGANEGLGDMVSDATTPLALGLDAVTGGLASKFRQAKRGVESVVDTVKGTTKTPVDNILTEEAALGVTPRTRPPSAEEQAGTKFLDPRDANINFATKAEADLAQPAPKPKIKVNQDGTFSPVDKPHLKYDNTGKLLTRTAGGGKPPDAPDFRRPGEPPEDLPDKPTMKRQIYDLARGSLSVDLPFITSAALRQAMPHVGTANWFKAWIPQAKAFGSELAYTAHLDNIRARELFKPREIKLPSGATKTINSYAEEAGLKLAEVGKYSKREEVLRNGLAERIPGFGRYVKASNRSYTAFLNDLRANAFQDLIENARSIAKSTGDTALDPDSNALLRKEIAEYVNNTTGAGSLNFRGPKGTELNLERHANALSEVMFSARNTASRVQMLNPFTYTQANPMVRKQYLNAALRTAGFWLSMGGLGKFAESSGLPVEVRLNPTSSDFGKIRMGNTRLDPAGGFQQFIVTLARQIMQESTPTTAKMGQEDKPKAFGGPGPYDPSMLSEATRFARNKLHPTIGLGLALADAARGSGVDIPDKILQTYVPMIAQDIIELSQEDPQLLALLPFISAGIGGSTFEKGDFNKPKLSPALNDFSESVLGTRPIPAFEFKGNIWGRQ